VSGSDGSWHEPLQSDGPPPPSSDRAFGLLLAAVGAGIAIIAKWEGRSSALWWSIAAFLFFIVALFAAPLLGPLNRRWRWVSLQLSRIVNPIIMSIVFFGVLTPVGIIMRLAGKDPLGLRYEPNKQSYWLVRGPTGERQTSMRDQF